LQAAPARLEQASMPSASPSGEAASDVRLSIGWGDNPPMPGLAAGTQIDLRWADPEPRPAAYAGAAWWQADTAGAGHGLAKSTLGIQDRPKLIVLTGFLGAGKTSFLTHFIEYQAARNGFVAVVQNEIGAKGLDGQLLGQHYAVAEIDEGCVCCTLAGSLKLALGDILHSYQPDFVVLETTGLANPANLLSEIADLEDHLEFASVTTVIDARLGLQTLQRYAVARDQVRLADVILLNKVDGEADQDLAMLEAAVRRLNPVASMCRVDHGDIAPSALYGVNLSMHRQPPIPEVVCCGAHGHGHDHEHGQHACGGLHASTHDDDGLASRIWTATGRLDRQILEKALSLLPACVLRVKGMVDLHGEAEPSVCQFVPGRYSLTPMGSVESDERFLVFIGENIDDAVDGFIESLSRNPERASQTS
jgi:G3E family GTPase